VYGGVIITVVKMSEKTEKVDVCKLFEQISTAENLSGDRWIDDEFCEELEYFNDEPEYVEKTEEGIYVAKFDLDTTLWYHEIGAVDVHIGIENSVDKFDGRSKEVDGSLFVTFEKNESGEIENPSGEIELENSPDVNEVYFTEPEEYHETPYKVE
jgi:hypothetical protein